MKKILVPIALLFALVMSPLVNADSEVFWSDIGDGCFEESSKIKVAETSTVKMVIEARSDMIFVQNDKALPSKLLKYNDDTHIDYNMYGLSGIDDFDILGVNNLYDGNINTSLDFDPYSDSEYYINLDLNRTVQAGSFKFRMNYESSLHPVYMIAEVQDKFINVSNIEGYSFRYLKIIFRDFNADSDTRPNLSINELSFLKKGKSTYLVNSDGSGSIYVYSGYQCEDIESLAKLKSQLKSQLKNDLNKVNFNINAKTNSYNLYFDHNINYKNDIDSDDVINSFDNCPFKSNADQEDVDGDFIGDACDLDVNVKNYDEGDYDKDGLGDISDNCPYIYNPMQQDSNADGVGDMCADDDNDGILGEEDNCKFISNRNQKDVNVNGVGDACEFDKDDDGIFDSIDNCVALKNIYQIDEDGDGVGDMCDNCKYYNPDQVDANNDSVGDYCERKEKYLKENDKDGDKIKDFIDNCLDDHNTNQADEDGDSIGDVCDNCLGLQNEDQADKNRNEIGDFCEDVDKDEIVSYLDNCPYHKNEDQLDRDNDGVGDLCEDEDSDGVLSIDDNCPLNYNISQSDIDKDGIGDLCDNKNDRFLESNKFVAIGLIAAVILIFFFMIWNLIRKLNA